MLYEVITEPRRQAIPWAVRCIDCQEVEEDPVDGSAAPRAQVIGEISYNFV